MQLVLTSREISKASETGVAGGKGDIGWCKMWEIPVNMWLKRSTDSSLRQHDGLECRSHTISGGVNGSFRRKW